ncbi:MAG: YpsA SLOG family protein [Streptosporangiaceae bacterium]
MPGPPEPAPDDAPPPGWRPASAAEPRLATTLRAGSALRVLTGGQTGVDLTAARAALAVGLPAHLVYPRGLRTEDGPLSPRCRERLRGARIDELGSAEFSDRTWTCVDLADAVILIDPAGGDGCRETARAARSLGRPLLDLSGQVRRPDHASPAEASPSAALVTDWLQRTSPRVLMLAGCRGSLLDAAGLGPAVTDLIEVVIGAARRWRDETGRPPD